MSVDNRGTGGRGSAFRHSVYLRMGAQAARDQIDAAKWLAKQPWVDASRIGIWGWSGGGHMTALCAFTGGTVYRAAASVAPVTDWNLYDDIYTERYMRTPAENPDGYRETAPLNFVDGLTATYLVVHGTGDDNVHPANTFQLIQKLQQSGKPFEMMLYPNKTHAIAGAETQAHLFATLTRFFDDALAPTSTGAAAAAASGNR